MTFTCPNCKTPDLPLAAFGPHGPRRKCRACESEYRQLYKHGVTSLDKENIAAAQGGCALCDRTNPGGKGWVVDHDRACCPGDKSCVSCRRAVLCQWCNNALGYASDNPELLRRMAAYLELGTRLNVSHLGVADESPARDSIRTDKTNEDFLPSQSLKPDVANARARIRIRAAK